MVRKASAFALAVCLSGLFGCYGLEDDVIPRLGTFTVTPLGVLVTTEAGGTAAFTVVLDRRPEADVVVPLSSSDAGEGFPSPTSLTFTPDDWDTPQTVTVAGSDDDVDDGNIAYTVLTLAAVSTDYHYDTVDAADVAASNTDDDTAGITVDPTSGLSTSENLTTATFTVVLDSEPTSNVTLALSSNNPSEGIVLSPVSASLTFTAANWDVPQTVTVQGVDDGSVTDLVLGAYTIVTAPAVSADPGYNGMNAANVDVSNFDNDAPGVIVTPTTLVTSEAGTLDKTFTVVLATDPSGTVEIDLTVGDPLEGQISTGAGMPATTLTLTFNSGNWSTAQVVTVHGVDDTDPTVDGTQTYTIAVTVDAAASVAAYDPIDPDDVSVDNLDDDTADILVSTSVLTTTENGPDVTFTVALSSVPAVPVTINIVSQDTSEGTIFSVVPLVFPASNVALTAQTVTVRPMDDSAIEPGGIVYTIEIQAASAVGDSNYNGRDAGDITVTNQDDDVPGIVVSATAITTNESGSQASFTVSMSSSSPALVTVTLSGLDTSEGSLSSAVLNFPALTPPGTAQTVTVTGLDDAFLDGPILYTLTGAVSSTDPNYGTLPSFTVDVTNNDNDSSPPGSSPGPGTVVLSPGAGGDFDDKRVVEPSVRMVASNDFRLWYEGSNAAGQKHDQVGYATGTDAVTWTKDPASPVLTHSGLNGTIDRNGVGDPCVLFDGVSTYRMWFGCRENAATKTKIGLATSVDGVAWTKHALTPGGPTDTILTGTAGQFDATGVASPHVILDGATYKMWYQGIDGSGIYRIGYATSSDGITWAKTPGAVLDIGAPGTWEAAGVSTPCVIKDAGVYRMWYIGRNSAAANGVQRMGFAQSADGITWIKYASNPILDVGAPGSASAARLWSPWVIKDGATYRIWYSGEDAGGDISLLYTTSP